MQLRPLPDRLRFPAAFLAALLQRSPAIRVAAQAADAVFESPVGAIIRTAAASLAALGAVDSVAGATTYTLSTGTPGEPSPLTVMESSNIGVAFALVANPPTAAPPGSWTIGGSIPPGMKFGVNGDFITAPGFVNTANPILEGTPTTPGTYTMTLQAWESPGGTGIFSSVFSYQVIVVAGPTPTFTTQPISVTIAGGTLALDAVATNSPAYQWFLNGSTPVAGATGPILLIANGAAAAGTYTCVATNSAGSATSNPATVTVSGAASVSRLTDLSARADVGTGSNILFAGFACGPVGQVSGTQTVLIRASGPALAQFGLASVLLPDPELQMFNNTTGVMFDSNIGWKGNAQIAALAASVGAFSWGTAPTNDSALIETVNPGTYTAQVMGASGDTGQSIAEIYDSSPSVTDAATVPRLVNLSARAAVGTGSNILFGGFAIGGGSTARTVLIRASGPALAAFGLSSVLLPDPQVVLFDKDGNVITSNSGWGGNPQISSTGASVGAFSWGTAPTKDSALLITLPAGTYTAQVSGVSGDTGQSIVEVYEVP
jgi:hypothetical protein